MSLPYGGGVDARVGVGAMEISSDQAFSGFLFSLWRKGTARELPCENKPCDQVTGTKALGLGLGFCPKLWIFLLLNGSLDIYWAQVAIGEQRSRGGRGLVG